MVLPSSPSHRALGWATCLLLPGFFVLTLLVIPSGTTVSSSAGEFVVVPQFVGFIAGLWGILAGVGILLERGWGRGMGVAMAMLMGLAMILWAPLVVIFLVNGRAEPHELWLVGTMSGGYLAYFGGHAVWTLIALWNQPTARGVSLGGNLTRIGLRLVDLLASLFYLNAAGCTLLGALIVMLEQFFGPFTMGPTPRTRPSVWESALLMTGALTVGGLSAGWAWLHFSAFLTGGKDHAGPRRRRMRTIGVWVVGLLGAAIALVLIGSGGAMGWLPLSRGDAVFAAILLGLAGILYGVYTAASHLVLRAPIPGTQPPVNPFAGAGE